MPDSFCKRFAESLLLLSLQLLFNGEKRGKEGDEKQKTTTEVEDQF